MWNLRSNWACACVQDTKEVLAQLREANFAAGEQREKVVALQTEVVSRQQQAQQAQQAGAELEAELALQVGQQQHLLDELSQSQVPPLYFPCTVVDATPCTVTDLFLCTVTLGLS